jgi:HlyD family secretion protein
MNKKLIIALLLITTISAGAFYFMKTDEVDTKEQITQTAIPITIGAISQTVFSDGVIASQETYNVYSDISSKILKTFYDEGDTVIVGDILAIMDTSDLLQSLKSAEHQLKVDLDNLKDLQTRGNSVTSANYQKSLNSYNSAKEDHANNEALYSAGIITADALSNSKATLDNAYVNYLSAKDSLNTTDIGSQIEQQTLKAEIGQMTIESILKDIEAATVVAPISGTIVSTVSDTHKNISNGELLYTIEDLTDLIVDATISEYEINDIEIGQKVLIETLGDDKVYHGQIISIAPKGSTGSEVTIPITIEINDEDQLLKPNFTANIEIVVAYKEKAMIVPYESIKETPRGPMLTILRNGEEMMIQVEKGIASDIYLEVISAEIQKDDEIIITVFNGTDSDKNGLIPGMGVVPGGKKTGNKRPAGN